MFSNTHQQAAPGRRPRRLRFAGVLTAAALAAVGSTPAAANDSEPFDASAYEKQLEARLGSGYAGFWLDGSTPQIAITDAALADDARAAGGSPRLVAHNMRKLKGVNSELDRAPESVPANVAGWGVDVRDNAVVISVVGKDAGAMGFARRWQARSDAVRIENVAEAPRPYWNVIGGQAIFSGGARCSGGFNARSASGVRYVVTAGHCTNSYATWSGTGGTLGTRAGSSFPGNDYGVIQVTSSAALSTPYVDRYSSGSDVRVTGTSSPAVGQAVCRSGSTTGWRCGSVTATNQTVCYAQGCVSQMIRTNACAEPGDSGGALVSKPSSGTVRAIGLTSGGSGNCSVGGTTYFQPITEPLGVYGLTLYT